MYTKIFWTNLKVQQKQTDCICFRLRIELNIEKNESPPVGMTTLLSNGEAESKQIVVVWR
jgi:hypothetical protein